MCVCVRGTFFKLSHSICSVSSSCSDNIPHHALAGFVAFWSSLEGGSRLPRLDCSGEQLKDRDLVSNTGLELSPGLQLQLIKIVDEVTFSC